MPEDPVTDRLPNYATDISECVWRMDVISACNEMRRWRGSGQIRVQGLCCPIDCSHSSAKGLSVNIVS